MSASPANAALKSLHPDLRRRLQRLDTLERQAHQARVNRWRAPPAPARDGDGWMVTYLDIVTLLLVMLVVLLGLTRAPLNPSADGAAVISLASAEAATDQASVADTTSPSLGASPSTADPDTAPLPPTAPLVGPDASTTPFALAAPHTLHDTFRAAVAVPPVDGAIAALDASVTDGAASTMAESQPIAPAADRILTPSPTLPEDGPWLTQRLRLPDPTAPSRWSLPAFAALAGNDPMPAPPAIDIAPPPQAPPSLDELGLTALGEGIDVIVNEQSVSFRISNEILFPSGQADLALTGSDVLDRLADALARHPHPLSVEGHTDIIPIQTDRFPSNWELSTSRATSVVRYLSRHGIASDRMRAVGHAHTRPLTSNDTAEGRSTNRRVELIMDIPPQRADRPAP